MVLPKIDEQIEHTNLLARYVIESNYVREISQYILNMSEEQMKTDMFKEVCTLLQGLCDRVIKSAAEIKSSIGSISVD
jgi:hypothetical protein